jgi:hypothetical protein
MRWLRVGVVILSAMATTGCPSEFGKDGRVGKAVHQDSQEQLLYITRCSEKMLKEVCARGKEDSDDCLRCRQGGVP